VCKLPPFAGRTRAVAIVAPGATAEGPTLRGGLPGLAGYRPNDRPQATARICYIGTIVAPRTHARTRERKTGGGLTGWVWPVRFVRVCARSRVPSNLACGLGPAAATATAIDATATNAAATDAAAPLPELGPRQTSPLRRHAAVPSGVMGLTSCLVEFEVQSCFSLRSLNPEP
jgi:hypothetical protein